MTDLGYEAAQIVEAIRHACNRIEEVQERQPSLRAYFAAKAMQGMLAAEMIDDEHETVAAEAVAYADALLAALTPRAGEVDRG